MMRWSALPVCALLAASGSAAAPDAIGLSVALDRPAGVYALDDRVHLDISVARAAAVRVWLRDPAGDTSPVIPATETGEPLRLRAGERVRLPRGGAGFRITPPAGRYEFLVVATGDAGGDRSLLDAGSRLAGQAVREQRTIRFTVEKI